MTRGLTMVELALTIGLLGIIGIPTGLLLGEHLRAALTSQDSTMAMQLARYEMESLDSFNNFFTSPAINCPGGGSRTTIIPFYQGYPYDLTRQVSCLLGDCCSTATDQQGVKRIQVTVTKSGSGDSLARLISYRTKCVCFGSGLSFGQTNCSNACS